MTTLKVGDPAPDFTLPGHDDQTYRLSDFRGRPVVLAFYPLDFSPVCSQEHACFVEDMSRLNALDAQVLGISVDSVWAHKAFAQKMGITYPLLADFHPKGEVARKYGVYLEDKGIAARTTFVVDAEGRIAHIQQNEILQVPDVGEIVDALARLSG
ncbi:MAG: peroxiredoxin [Chloroflexi bacterium]|nr:MAG: peroxiredoxin [Chloroflexota bacterium]